MVILVYGAGHYDLELVPRYRYDYEVACKADLKDQQKKLGLPMICIPEGIDL